MNTPSGRQTDVWSASGMQLVGAVTREVGVKASTRAARGKLVGWVGGGVDEVRHQGAMHMDWKWFSEEVGKVIGSFDPDELELTLADAVAHPVEAHVNCFAAAYFEGIVGDADGTAVVTEDGGGGLRVAQIIEGCAEVRSCLEVGE